MLIAHRGLTNKFIKENTLKSFLNALKNKYDGIELDIRKTKDNKIVVIHDSLINRTSNGRGFVKNYTYKDLKKFNFGSKKEKAKIPLLKEVLENINNTNILIELKEKFTKKEIEKILTYNKTNKIYFCSFFTSFLEPLKSLEYPIGLINYLLNSNIDYNKYDFYLLYYKLYNDSILKKMNRLNKLLFLYGIKDFTELKNTKYDKLNLNYIVER